MTENPAAAAAVDPDTAARLLSGAYHDPHAILGAHATPRGTVLRTLKPGATAVAAVIGGESYPLAQLQGALWGAEVPITELADYRYEVLYPAGSTVVADGYRFLPTIGELDQHLISEGRHERLWDVLGAHLRSYTTPDGEYVSVQQALDPGEGWVDTQTNNGARVGTFETRDGRTWTKRDREGKVQRSLVHRQTGEGELTTLVTGTGTFEQLETFANHLEAVDVPTR